MRPHCIAIKSPVTRVGFCAPARDIEAAKLCGLQIYVNLGIAVEIEEMGIDESSDMRDYLRVDVLQPRYRDTHRWSVGDVLLWERGGAWHCAVADCTAE